jgi:hypothetical protein
MREVEPNVNFVMDQHDPSIDSAPTFERTTSPDGQGTLTLEDEIEEEVAEAERA